MKTADKTKSTHNEEQAGKEQQQQAAGEEDAAGSHTSWWEQLTGTLFGNKGGPQNGYSFLSTPLVLLIGLLLLGYWLFIKNGQTNAQAQQENEQLKREMEQLKKKYKKLKKRRSDQPEDNSTGHRFTDHTVLD